uniref:Uncharacterized protein n=1 Tax=Anguilla anguilla TaxID=7936 RepID=A0A0E9UIP3_ANGAN
MMERISYAAGEEGVQRPLQHLGCH